VRFLDLSWADEDEEFSESFKDNQFILKMAKAQYKINSDFMVKI
jgi:hypothetical protein